MGFTTVSGTVSEKCTGFQAVHATASEKPAAFTATQAVVAWCLENAIWEEADYLAVCTVREVMVLPPYFHAGSSDARRAAAGGRNRLRVCETKGFLGDRCVDCSKNADFPGDRPGDRCKTRCFLGDRCFPI